MLKYQFSPRTLRGVLVFLLACGPVQALAASSNWEDGQGGAVRLISEGAPDDGTYRAGLEFSLEPGWHTYWRAPGEAGIPPQIDLSASKNLASANVLYPVPERFNDGYSTSAVYHEEVVLPIEVRPQDAGKPVQVEMQLFFGVCREICVPRDATLSLTLAPQDAEDRTSRKLVERDLARVPLVTAVETSGINLTASPDGKALDIIANVGIPLPEPLDLFVEGPEGSYNAMPELTAKVDGKATWRLPTNGLKREEDGTSALRVVLHAGQKLVETHLDIPAELMPSDE